MQKGKITTIEKPSRMEYWNVMYWCPESQELLRQKKDGSTEAATLLSKAETFLLNGCIERFGSLFVCRPLKGYNKTTYKIKSNPWVCDCQGFNSKIKNGETGNCSHILAVKQFIFMENYNAEKK